MKKSFGEVTEAWMLTGMVLAQRMLEVGRALAKTPADFKVLDKIFEHYKAEIMSEISKRKHLGHDLSQEEIVLQISTLDCYTGKLLHGRFQVMGSVLPQGTFYLVDHAMPDLLCREGGPGSNIRRFHSVKEAEDYAGTLAQSLIIDSPPPNPGKHQQKVDTMAKTPTAAKAATKPTPAPKAARASGPTAAARFRELIMEGKLTDDAIFDKVAKEFNLDEKKRTYVAWYRNDLTKKGENPPAPLAAATKPAPKAPAKAPAATKPAPKALAKAPAATKPAPKAPAKVKKAA